METAKRTNHPGASPDPQDVGGVAKWAGPSWLPETYNLLYELPRLVHRYMQAQERYVGEKYPAQRMSTRADSYSLAVYQLSHHFKAENGSSGEWNNCPNS